MAKRKSLSPSVRWSVFARDNFTCRYCGAQAGQEGVELQVDHIISVVDGGDNSISNLATSCRKCNGGKSARSLSAAPLPEQVAEAERKRVELIQQQAEAVRIAVEAAQKERQYLINAICAAYDIERFDMKESDLRTLLCWGRRYGWPNLIDWIHIAVSRRISEYKLSRYVGGIVRSKREQGEIQ